MSPIPSISQALHGEGPSTGEQRMQEETGHSDFDDSFLQEVAQVSPPFREPAPGERLGGSDGRRFEVLGELGGGAMGQVFRARDAELEREVALKFLLPREGQADHGLMEPLRREARAVAQLDHDNIVRIFDVAEWSGKPWEPRIPFLIMECLEGESLAALLRREPRLGVRRALEIMSAVASGLAHAHDRHIVHRDLKPSNVFLSARGTVKLLDFGLAWLMASGGSPAPHLPEAGTPPYMSPEQWRREPQDERTDLWSAGVMLYEMLTGELPYRSDTLEDLRAKVVAPARVPSVRALRPEVPEEVEALVASALAKEPRERLPSAVALRDRLRWLEERLGPWREEPSVMAPQRRPVTLVSCKLAGLGGLAEGLDSEDLSELEAEFQKRCSETMQRHGGSITLCMGDEVLACFGYPVAREEDSEYAVRAALDLVGSLQVQVGVHTELVVFDDILPELRGRTPTIQGEAPRIASWLARRARPGAVVLSNTTHTLVQRAFEAESLGPLPFEGLSGARAVDAWRVQRARKSVFRFDRALVAGALSPLVGREEELCALASHWEEARAGRGSVVLLTGEAGIGKSRVIQELRSQVACVPSLRGRCQCWSQFANSAFHPIVEMFQHLFRLDPEGSPKENLHRLEGVLGALDMEATHMALIASFLSLPVKENLPFFQLSPDLQKERTIEALVALLLRMAEQQPVFGVVEDLHWADPSTLELLDATLSQVGNARVLLVLSARPGFRHAWPPSERLHRVVVERLPARLSATLIQEAAGKHALSEETVAHLVAKTDGIPLFVEEMTRMVVGGGALPSIPVTLHELLLARLDRLPARQKALAQLCAVVGRGFSHALLATLTRRPAAALDADVEELVSTGLLQPVEEEEDEGPSYQFRHALLQDAAYQSLLRSTRREHHRRIAQSLLEQFPEVVETQPELLAHHYTEAGECEQAIGHWLKAGIRASLRSANLEAVSHIQQALKQLRALPDAPQRIQQELQLLIALGIPLSQVQGYRSPEVKRTYTRARELFQRVGEALPSLELSYWGPYAYSFARAEYPLSHELAVQLVGLGSRQHNRELLSLGYRMMATDFFAWGRLEDGREYVERAVVCSDFSMEEHRRLAVRHFVEPRSMALIHASVIHSVLGQTERARRYAHEALELAGRVGHANTRAYVLLYAALSCQLRRDAQGTLALAEECHAVSREHWFRLWSVWSGLLRAWALAELGMPEEGLEQLREWLGRWRVSGLKAGMPHNLGLLADVHLRLGEPREALLVVHEGLKWVEALGERFYEAELYRIGAEAQRALGHEEQVHEYLLQAMRVSRAQGAREFERHAVLALGPPPRVPGARPEAPTRV